MADKALYESLYGRRNLAESLYIGIGAETENISRMNGYEKYMRPGSRNPFKYIQPVIYNPVTKPTGPIIREPAALVKDVTLKTSDITDGAYYTSIMHDNGLFQKSEIDLYNKIYRYGLMNPYDTLSIGKEYLFFTKPDLHINIMDDTGQCSNKRINTELEGNLFWEDLYKNRQNTVRSLQDSFGRTFSGDRFNHLLQNTCRSNLDVPALNSEMVDTPVNLYGVGFSYRGSSEDSDDGPEFSLEFLDTKWLDVYYFFKAYEEYETLKHHGAVSPWQGYTINKIVHDSFSIYKFILDEDMETIIYFGKMYGVTPTSLPRDTFSSPQFDNGITYNVNFKAAFYEDMKIDILSDFNDMSKSYADSLPYDINIYNTDHDRVDGRPAQAAYVVSEENSYSSTGYVYKLKWKGSDSI